MGIVTAPERLTKEGHLNGKWRMDVKILTDFVSIQFCCDKWRLSEATGNDLSVTDFVGDSSPERGAKRKTERQPWLPFQGSCQPLG